MPGKKWRCLSIFQVVQLSLSQGSLDWYPRLPVLAASRSFKHVAQLAIRHKFVFVTFWFMPVSLTGLKFYVAGGHLCSTCCPQILAWWFLTGTVVPPRGCLRALQRWLREGGGFSCRLVGEARNVGFPTLWRMVQNNEELLYVLQDFLESCLTARSKIQIRGLL